MSGQLLLFESSVPADNNNNLWNSFPNNRLNGFISGQKGITITNKEKFKQLDIKGGKELSKKYLYI